MPETAASIRITLPDGSVRDVQPGTTPADIAADIGAGLARQHDAHVTSGSSFDGMQ